MSAPPAPVIVVHSLAHALAALRAAAQTGQEVVIASAPEAGNYTGAGWFQAVVEAGHKAVPAARFAAILDCGDRAGAALAAIRSGIERVVFTGRADVAGRLADIARQQGVRLETERPIPALDLGDGFFASAECLERRCAEILASAPPFC